MEANKKKGAGMYILVGAVVLAIGTGVYYFATRTKDAKEPNNDFEPESTPPAPVQQAVTPRTTSSYNSSGFPIRNGSRGQYVRQLQLALIDRYGSSILPRYGADGDWGSETTNALISKGLPTVIDSAPMLQAVISKISKKETNSQSSSSASSGSTSKNNITSVARAKKIAGYFRYAIKKKDFKNVNYLLSLLKTPDDYSVVSEFFKSQDMHDGTKRTLLIGVFRFFKDKYYQENITEHFKRMGLKERNGKWTLSGLGNILYDQIKVVRTSKIWNAAKQTMQVPKNTILGEFISANHGVTKFRTIDGKLLFTSTENVRYV